MSIKPSISPQNSFKDPGVLNLGITAEGTGPISLATPQLTSYFSSSSVFLNADFHAEVLSLPPPTATHGPFARAAFWMFEYVPKSLID